MLTWRVSSPNPIDIGDREITPCLGKLARQRMVGRVA